MSKPERKDQELSSSNTGSPPFLPAQQAAPAALARPQTAHPWHNVIFSAPQKSKGPRAQTFLERGEEPKRADLSFHKLYDSRFANFGGQDSALLLNMPFFSRLGKLARERNLFVSKKVRFPAGEDVLEFQNLCFERVAELPRPREFHGKERQAVSIRKINGFALPKSAQAAQRPQAREAALAPPERAASPQSGPAEAEGALNLKRASRAPKRGCLRPKIKKKGSKACNCRNSKCLKFYCDCFKSLGYCGAKCSCADCRNDPKFEAERSACIEAMKKNAPVLVEHKIQIKDLRGGAPPKSGGLRKTPKVEGQCRCQKSSCLKNYCDCFAKGRKCGPDCNCKGCRNGPE